MHWNWLNNFTSHYTFIGLKKAPFRCSALQFLPDANKVPCIHRKLFNDLIINWLRLFNSGVFICGRALSLSLSYSPVSLSLTPLLPILDRYFPIAATGKSGVCCTRDRHVTRKCRHAWTVLWYRTLASEVTVVAHSVAVIFHSAWMSKGRQTQRNNVYLATDAALRN